MRTVYRDGLVQPNRELYDSHADTGVDSHELVNMRQHKEHNTEYTAHIHTQFLLQKTKAENHTLSYVPGIWHEFDDTHWGYEYWFALGCVTSHAFYFGFSSSNYVG